MIYGLNFNGTQLPVERDRFPETVRIESGPKSVNARICGMTNDPDSVRQMMIVASNGKRKLTTLERVANKVTWWAVYCW